MTPTLFKSTHNLDFLCAAYDNPLEAMGIKDEFTWIRFKVGTCHGLWAANDKSFLILAVENDEKGNGHFNDVLEWFEQSCKRENKTLIFVEVMNTKFKQYLMNKQGFQAIEWKNSVEKTF